MHFEFDDGGRAAAGYKGSAGDCVCRAISIASGMPYAEVYKVLAEGRGSQRASRKTGKKKSASARDGINTTRKWFKDQMVAWGFVWTPCMAKGTGCQVHLRAGEVPMSGRIVCSLSKHYAAVIDGVIRDTHDPSRNGTRCVYGYWTYAKA